VSVTIAADGEHSPSPFTLDPVPPSGFVLQSLGEDRWSLGGELDWASGPMLLPAASATFPPSPVLYMHCDRLEFIDVAGWRALRAVRRQLEPASELRLCHPSPVVRRLISVIGHP